MTEDKSKSAASQRIVSLQIAAAEFLKGKPPWVLGVYVALRRFIYVAIPVVIWSIVLLFEGILPESLAFGFTLVIVVTLFLLSIPLSLLQRLDLLLVDINSFTGNSKAVALLFMLAYVLANFVLIGGLRGLIRGWLRR